MKILMDTHAFLWFIEGDNNLSDAARSLIENNQYQKRLSIASLWEMSIKASLNRLELKTTFPNLIQNYVFYHCISQIMPILSTFFTALICDLVFMQSIF